MGTLIREIRLRNLLSFGPDTEPLELKPLNVLIGPNGSGKSNLLEAISILQAAPKDLSAPIKEGGGVHDWLWKGERNPTASIEVILENRTQPESPLRHSLSFTENSQRFEVMEERIETKDSPPNGMEPDFFYKSNRGLHVLSERKVEGGSEERALKKGAINAQESVLSQVKDPDRYPILSYLEEVYEGIRLYREWSFGRYSSPRKPQKADLPSHYLSESCDNLAHVLNSLRPKGKSELLERLSTLYSGIDDFNVQFPTGWVQLFLEEGDFSIPATRLSDGTLRYLCLLAILCHPDPPPLVGIEEPELGLHPDVLPELANLLKKASERCQLIVTTHSEILVDELSENPETLIVTEKYDGSTVMKRLGPKELEGWLVNYRGLADAWRSGEIGGNRW